MSSSAILRVVFDTNVLIAGLKSNRGTSYALLRSLLNLDAEWQICLSTPVLLEYEDVLKRSGLLSHLTWQDVDDILDYVCSRACLCRYLRWWTRPILHDPKDECFVELAVNAGAEIIVTFNIRDFSEAARVYGIRIMTPSEFLKSVRPRP